MIVSSTEIFENTDFKRKDMRFPMLTKVAVIGGGAAGMMAAITAARQGCKVTIIEKQRQLGRKILSTGNGRCNFTNEVQEPYCYRSSNPDFPFAIYKKFPFKETLEFFKELGIYPKSRKGYIYPHSDQASAVVDTMMMELRKLKVEVHLNTYCEGITLENEDNRKGLHQVLEKGQDKTGLKSKFSVLVSTREDTSTKINKRTIQVDKVILTTGGKAAPKLGSDGSGYALAESFGHHIIPVLPSLVQLKCEESFYKHLAGIRMDGRISIHVKGQEIAYDTGEIQLTNYGISGIPVFQVSGFVAKELAKGNEVTGLLNLMPHLSLEELESLLNQRIASNPQKLMDEFLIGLLPKKLSEVMIQLCEMNPREEVSHMMIKDSRMLKRLALQIAKFKTKIIDTNSFEQAQVCQGGVDTREVHPDTLESFHIPGLYFAGEILDVDGICGGYNLQWAWSSGAVAGR